MWEEARNYLSFLPQFISFVQKEWEPLLYSSLWLFSAFLPNYVSSSTNLQIIPPSFTSSYYLMSKLRNPVSKSGFIPRISPLEYPHFLLFWSTILFLSTHYYFQSPKWLKMIYLPPNLLSIFTHLLLQDLPEATQGNQLVGLHTEKCSLGKRNNPKHINIYNT